MNTNKIGNFISKKRIEKGLKQKELAEILYVTDKTISRWENGNYMPDLSILIKLAETLNVSVYELLLGEELVEKESTNIETEIRFLYSLSEENKILSYLNKFQELTYKGCFDETTIQYNHPMKEYNNYSKEIDARFRVRTTKNNEIKKTMITYKRRGENFLNEEINSEEEVEVSIDYKDTDNLLYLLKDVLHMELVESYSRRRHVYSNEDIEVVVDIYPFMIAIEVENKSINKDPKAVVLYYLNLLGFNLKDSYRLSWDDKYEELCKEQSIKQENIVDNTKQMPNYENHLFELK